jgi:hypothetical protein
MGGDHLEVAITMCDGLSESQRHRCDLAVDQTADGLAGSAATPMNGGDVLVSAPNEKFHHDDLRNDQRGTVGDSLGKPMPRRRVGA